MKQIKIFAVAGILLVLISLVAITSYTALNKNANQTYDEKFYVGVTYCGSSIEEAKELVDKVKDYTNLFVLQSGVIRNTADVEEIGDYVVASELNFVVYASKKVLYGTNSGSELNKWVNTLKERWNEQFIGLYYDDEPGGNMLDGPVDLNMEPVQIRKLSNGAIEINYDTSAFNYYNTTGHTFYPDGGINVKQITSEDKSGILIIEYTEGTSSVLPYNYSEVVTDYFPNGTIIIAEREYVDRQPVSTNFYYPENITKYSHPILSYVQILKQNPIQNYDGATEAFMNLNKAQLETINKKQLNEESMIAITSDYGLYWWDYQSGYDVILAELAWNNSITQEIGLVRGAANLQGKSWGTCITWKYTHPPYLTDGKEMFEQMKTSYQTGAEYVVIFNYSEDLENPNTLQEEHFQALERFWNDVVQNPKVNHGSIKANAVLVLPQNYGWGIRHPDDHIWGIWRPDGSSQQIWNQLQDKQNKHGLKLDIVFEDPNYPVTEKYGTIYYWNQE